MLVALDIFVLPIFLIASVIGHHRGSNALLAHRHGISKRQATTDNSNFYIITKTYPDAGKQLQVGNETSLSESGFDPSHPTRVLIHGWMGDRFSLLNQRVSAAYLRRGDYNVIVVDWSAVAAIFDYARVKRDIPMVALEIVELLEFLISKGEITADSIYLIGHSLGAHLAGAVGRRLQSGKIGVIAALDPALPLYMFDIEDRVSQLDADHVLSIHTNGGVTGIYAPVGHVSFYPNWGVKQPRCGIDLLGSCSHVRSIGYFAESLEGSVSKFKARRCNDIFFMFLRLCPGGGDAVLMGGDPINRTYRGIYYVPI